MHPPHRTPYLFACSRKASTDNALDGVEFRPATGGNSNPQPQTAVSLHHTGALLTETTDEFFTAHNRRSEGHSRVKPPTPTTNPMKNQG